MSLRPPPVDAQVSRLAAVLSVGVKNNRRTPSQGVDNPAKTIKKAKDVQRPNDEDDEDDDDEAEVLLSLSKQIQSRFETIYSENIDSVKANAARAGGEESIEVNLLVDDEPIVMSFGYLRLAPGDDSIPGTVTSMFWFVIRLNGEVKYGVLRKQQLHPTRSIDFQAMGQLRKTIKPGELPKLIKLFDAVLKMPEWPKLPSKTTVGWIKRLIFG